MIPYELSIILLPARPTVPHIHLRPAHPSSISTLYPHNFIIFRIFQSLPQSHGHLLKLWIPALPLRSRFPFFLLLSTQLLSSRFTRLLYYILGLLHLHLSPPCRCTL